MTRCRIRAAARGGRRSSRTARRRGSRAAIRTRRACSRRSRQDALRRTSPGSDRPRACRGARSGTAAACGGCRRARFVLMRDWHGPIDIAMLGRNVSPAFGNPSYRVMRPALLDRLFAPVTVLPGIGATLAQADRARRRPQCRRSAVASADRASSTAAPHLASGRCIRATGRPVRSSPSRPGSSGISRASGAGPTGCSSATTTGALVLVYFNAKGDYLQRLLPVGAERIVSGQIEYYDGMPQIAHPDHVVPADEAERIRPIEPVYPLTAGLSSRVVAKAIAAAVRARAGAARMARSGAQGAARLAGMARGASRRARAARRRRSRPRDPAARASGL